MSKLKIISKALKALSGNSDDAAKVIETVATPEIAAKLSAAERGKYLKALDTVYGSRNKRAADGGWGSKQTFYHGTPSADKITAFDPTKATQANTIGPGRDLGSFFSSNPAVASEYATEAGSVLPVKINRKGQSAIESDFSNFNYDTAENAREILKDGKNVTIKDIYDSPRETMIKGDTVIVKDPSTVRSINAAFDPRFKSSSNIMAGVAAMPAMASTSETMNPLNSLRDLSEGYQNLLNKAYDPLAEQLDLTKDGSAKEGIKDTLNLVADPLNVVSGPLVLGAEALMAAGEAGGQKPGLFRNLFGK